jgi:hypothetical protein
MYVRCGPSAQASGGEFEKYAAAEEDEELDLGDAERDRFKFDHVSDSMMMPKVGAVYALTPPDP